MAHVNASGDVDSERGQLLPVDSDGVCMSCKETPYLERMITCASCGTAWHVDCLKECPETTQDVLGYVCPDCSGGGLTGAPAPSSGGELVAKIRSIEGDVSLTEREKAKKRQELLSGKIEEDEEEQGSRANERVNDALALLSESFKCSFCMQLPERPVTVFLSS